MNLANTHLQKHFKKYVAIFLLCILLIITYILLPTIAKSLVSHQLAKAGFTSALQLSHPTHNTLTIDKFELTGNSEQPDLLVRIQGINIHYNLLTLIFTGKLEQVSIAALTAHYIPTSTESINQQPLSIKLEDFLPSQLFAQLPLQQLAIEQFNVSTTTEQTHLALQGSALYQAGKLEITSDYLEQNKVHATLTIETERNNQFTTNIAFTDANAQAPKTKTNESFSPAFLNVQLQGSFNTQKDASVLLDIQQDINFSAFSTRSYWAKKYTHLPEVRTFLQQLVKTQGSLAIKHKLSIPETLVLSAQALKDITLLTTFTSTVNNKGISRLIHDLIPDETTYHLEQAQADFSGVFTITNNEASLILNTGSALMLNELAIAEIKNSNVTMTLASDFETRFSLPDTDTHYTTTNRPRTDLSISPFNLLITANDWQNQSVSIKHQPISVQLNNFDSKLMNANISFQLPQVTLSATSSDSLPFQQAHLAVTGSVNLDNHSLQLNLDKNTQLAIKAINTGKITANQLSITSDNAIKFNYDLADQTSTLTDFSLFLDASQWQHPLAKITTAPASIYFSKIDLLHKTLAIKSSPLTVQARLYDQPLESIEITSQLTADFSKHASRFTLADQSRISLKNLHQELTVKAVDLSNTGKLTLHLANSLENIIKDPLSSTQLILEPAQLDISASPISVDQQTFSFQSLQITTQEGSILPLDIKAKATLKGIADKNNPAFGTFNIYSSHRFQSKDYQGYLNITSQTLPLYLAVDINSYNNFQTSYAKWLLKPIDLAKNATALTSLLNRTLSLNLTNAVTVDSGSFAMNGKLSHHRSKNNSTIVMDGEHQLTNLSLHRENAQLNGFNYTAKMQLKNNKLSHQGQLNIEQILSVIPISELSTQLTTNNLLAADPDLTIKNLRANVLGGQFTLEPLSTTLNSLNGQSTLHFTDLPLAQIVALEQQPSISADGLLKGSIPFTFSKNDVWVNNGAISAVGNGSIHYQASDAIKATANTNSGLQIALAVLENFYYDKLQVSVQYSPDGQLILRNNLAGNNPDWQNGQPIDFSINIEENLIQLFKALMFSSTLTDNIAEKLQNTNTQ